MSSKTGAREVRRGGGAPGGRRQRGTLLAALALGLIVVAAAAVPEGLSLLEEDATNRMVVPEIPTLMRYLIAGIGALMVIALILLRVAVMGSEGKVKRSRRSRWRWVALILVAAALWATFAAWRQEPVTTQETRPGALPTPVASVSGAGTEPEQGTTEYSEPLGWVVGGLFALALAAMTAALLLLFRKEPEDLRRFDIDDALRDELAAGLDDLLDIDDPRTAVIACYSRMETVVELAGIGAAASDTPFELLARLLRERRVSETSARRLTELFEEAKFSIRPIDEPMRQEALSAVAEVRRELTVQHHEVVS